MDQFVHNLTDRSNRQAYLDRRGCYQTFEAAINSYRVDGARIDESNGDMASSHPRRRKWWSKKKMKKLKQMNKNEK